MKKRSLICKIKDAFLPYKNPSWLAISIFTFLFASCTNDPFDGESFSSDVRNQTLQSPNVEDIVFTVSPDGSQTKITWPVVQGASGYLCSVFDVTNPDAPAVVEDLNEKLIDGCSVIVPRADDSNYTFSIKALGNTALNNKDAETATEVAFSSFVPEFTSIPSGTDLYEYFQNNPLPTDNKDELPINLDGGGNYTVSGILDFGANRVTLRCTNKYNRPVITYGDNGTIRTSAPLTLKNIIFDCSASADAAIGLSKEPAEGILGATGSGDYQNIMGALYITNCQFDGVNSQLIYDNSVKYCLETILIDNTVVKLTSTQASGVSGNAVIYFKTGYANSLSVKNSTFYQASKEADAKYFVQYNNSGRNDRGGYARNSVSYTNSTFYNIAKEGQWGNYSGFAGRATSDWIMKDCIFVDCGSNQICRRFLGGRTGQQTAIFSNNTYMFNGGFENTDGYDDTATRIEEDPMFANPANGDFTVNGASQLAKRTGDPRWLPATE